MSSFRFLRLITKKARPIDATPKGMKYRYPGVCEDAVEVAVADALTTRFTGSGDVRKPFASTQYVPAASPLVVMFKGSKFPLVSEVAARFIIGIAEQPPPLDVYT